MSFKRIDRFLTSERPDETGEPDKLFIETDQIWDGLGIEEEKRRELYSSLSENEYTSAIVLVKGDPYELDLTGFDNSDYRVGPEGDVEPVDPATDIINKVEAFYRETY